MPGFRLKIRDDDLPDWGALAVLQREATKQRWFLSQH